MRRFTFVLSLVAGLALLAPRVSSAQVAIELGVKGGIAIADLDVEDDAGIDSRTGLVGGGFATFGIGNNFSSSPSSFTR